MVLLLISTYIPEFLVAPKKVVQNPLSAQMMLPYPQGKSPVENIFNLETKTDSNEKTFLNQYMHRVWDRTLMTGCVCVSVCLLTSFDPGSALCMFQ